MADDKFKRAAPSKPRTSHVRYQLTITDPHAPRSLFYVPVYVIPWLSCASKTFGISEVSTFEKLWDFKQKVPQVYEGMIFNNLRCHKSSVSLVVSYY